MEEQPHRGGFEMKKPMLAVWIEPSLVPGEVAAVNWEFGDKIEIWRMVGVLETIKKELLDMVDKAKEEENNS